MTRRQGFLSFSFPEWSRKVGRLLRYRAFGGRIVELLTIISWRSRMGHSDLLSLDIIFKDKRKDTEVEST